MKWLASRLTWWPTRPHKGIPAVNAAERRGQPLHPIYAPGGTRRPRRDSPDLRRRRRDTDFVKPEGRKLWFEIMNREQNFFKHADKDPDGVLEFNPDIVPFTLYDGTVMYRKLTGRILREGAAFGLWFVLKYPQFLKSDALGEPVTQFKMARSHVDNLKAFLVLLERSELWPDTD